MGMPEETPSSKFPQTSQDITNLKQTATDAASKAKGQLQDLKEHAVSETYGQLDQIKGSLGAVVESVKSYSVARPFLCLAIAATVGFVFGSWHRACCNNRD